MRMLNGNTTLHHFHRNFRTVDCGNVIVIQNDVTPHILMYAIYNELTKFSMK